MKANFGNCLDDDLQKELSKELEKYGEYLEEYFHSIRALTPEFSGRRLAAFD